MSNKTILGLDLGTNSIGWALIEQNFEEKQGSIIGMGSRIIPMSQDIIDTFGSGQSVSQTAERTRLRSIRRLRERFLLRRERLHQVLHRLGFLPEHYAAAMDFETRPGKFFSETEPKLAFKPQEKAKPLFIFQNSFEEMLADFKKQHPELLTEGKKIPYDWTIYYLRKKALSEKIEKEELAWLLLHFNQKRGYNQLRGEEDEDATRTAKTRTYFATQKISCIQETGVYKHLKIFTITLENGETGKYFARNVPEWEGQVKHIIVTVDTDKNGEDRLEEDGSVSRRFTIPSEKDWEEKWKLVKIKTEQEIGASGKTVGAFIYDALLEQPGQKIKGKLVRTIERKFYKEELQNILDVQKEFHSELNDVALYQACIELLYPSNEAHRNNIAAKDFTHLFLEDILFYQRPLKSKTSLISDCRFESRSFMKDGQLTSQPLKAVPKSHLLFQEFRLWQWLQNLRIYQKEKEIDGRTILDVDVTSEFLKEENDWVALYDWLQQRKEIKQEQFLKYPAFNLKKNAGDFRWNYVEDKVYPLNETGYLISSGIQKLEDISANFLTPEIEEAIWHILYSVHDKQELERALQSFARKHHLDETAFIAQFRKCPPFKNEYGAYSAKAIKKLLPLMRMGKYWNADAIHPQTKERIEKIINGEYDESIQNRVREKSLHLNNINNFRGLPVWLASYIVYDRHSEDGNAHKWSTPAAIEDFLRNEFKQHSLRNPIVEQIITETLRVVADIWKYYGEGAKNFFDEIHVELGRDLKNPKADREKMTKRNQENENTNLRIKALLAEMAQDPSIENVRPHSPMQQELLKIYEEAALSSSEEIAEDILKISKAAQPSSSELAKYKMWLEQKYRSPYTGSFIPLSKLFTPEYEIEHVIPQSRFFDDSFSNKVICEAAVNRDKDNQLGYEYIKANHGKKIELGLGKAATILSVAAYEDLVKKTYAANRTKMKKLLLDEIPDSFIERQKNDMRYISKEVKRLLSNIVRVPDEKEATSKNLLSTNGSITSRLRQDWGLNDVWNDLITPRFIRMNELTQSMSFGSINPNTGKFLPTVPLGLSKNFNKKRIDHRHHALDALVIACATRNHINYLNNENANGKEKHKPARLDLRNKLRHVEQVQIQKIENGVPIQKSISVAKDFIKPWPDFTKDAREKLGSMVVSFKQNLRIINKTTNKHQAWVPDGNGGQSKNFKIQTKGESWAIRKPLHKDTVYGQVSLRFLKEVSLTNAIENWQEIADKSLRKAIKELVEKGLDKKKILQHFKAGNNQWEGKDISRVSIWQTDNGYVASRVKVDDSFDSKKIQSITDSGIQKIMLAHLAQYNETDGNGKVKERPDLAFSPEGLEAMNKNIVQLNGGKKHQPISKVRTYEPLGNKFQIGNSGNKNAKWVEAAKGTNLFFGVYADENGNRNYITLPLHVAIERQKQGLSAVPEANEAGHKLLFSLSPNELVYLPAADADVNFSTSAIDVTHPEFAQRMYKVVSFTGNRLYAIPVNTAKAIADKIEFTQLNKLEFSIDGQSIKKHCIKVVQDRLGNLVNRYS